MSRGEIPGFFISQFSVLSSQFSVLSSQFSVLSSQFSEKAKPVRCLCQHQAADLMEAIRPFSTLPNSDALCSKG
jgi:hypothetical protein